MWKYASFRSREQNQSICDLLQRDHPERPSHEGVIQASEIEDGPEAAILFGDEEVTAVKAWPAQSWRNHFYGSFFHQRHHLWAQNASVLALHRGGDHAAETRGSSSELEWITSFYYPHNPLWHSGDGLPDLGPRGKGLDKKIALFLRMFVFYFFHYHSGQLRGRLYGPCSNRHNSLCTRKRTGCQEVSHERPFGGRSGRGGTRPSSLPVLQIRRTPGAQGPTLSCVGGPGASEGVASGWMWTPSRLLSPSRLRGENGRCRFRGLLSRRSPGATLSSCWAGALGQEVSHSLWRLLCFCEALSESFHRRSKEATGGHWSIKEGDPVRVLDLRLREPQVALEHYQAGHRPSYGLGGSLGGLQSQVRCASQLPESRRIRLRLIYGREELGLIDLKNRHRVEPSSWSVGASSERWSDPAWLGRVTGLRLPADGSGWAEMCSHWLIQLRHPLISLFFSAVNHSEGGWSGSTEAGRVRGAPRSRELVMNFREERRWLLLRGLMAPRQKPLIQTAARGLLWWRPLQTQLFNRFWEDTEKFGIHPGFGGAGRGQTWGGGVNHWARQLLSIWSYQWHAVIGQLIVTSPERDQIAHTCRGTLVRLDKKDGRHLSVWRKRGTRDLSRHELALNRALRTSAPLFFPHRSLGGRKREGARGGIALWKESDARAQRGETDALAVRTIRTSERGIRMGFPQAGNTLAVTVIGVQGRPAWAAVTAWH